MLVLMFRVLLQALFPVIATVLKLNKDEVESVKKKRAASRGLLSAFF